MLDLIRQLHIKEGPSSRRSQKASAVGSFKSGPSNPVPALIVTILQTLQLLFTLKFEHSQN